MKEHPILFSPVMVEAIQEGRKTMTRREIKDLFEHCTEPSKSEGYLVYKGKNFYKPDDVARECKYQIGDRLWVKETHFLFGAWVPNGNINTGQRKWRFVPNPLTEVRYLDNPPLNFKTSRDKENPGLPKWYKRNSLFMPKWASRITLEVTAIRAEKVKEISEQDAMAEGVEFKLPKITSAATGWKHCQSGFYNAKNASHSFFTLWEKINGEQSLESNPYVWVITFKKIKQ